MRSSLALLVGVGATGLRNTTEFAADLGHLQDERRVSVIQLGRAKQALYERQLGGAGAACVSASAARRAELLAAHARWLAQLDASPSASTSHADLATLQRDYPEILESRVEIIALVDRGLLAEPGELRRGPGPHLRGSVSPRSTSCWRSGPASARR